MPTAIAFLGIAVFPLLGNALALLLGLPRRPVQLLLLAAFAGVLAVSVSKAIIVNGLRSIPPGKPFSLTLAASVIILIPARITAVMFAGTRPGAYAWAAAVLTVAWLALCARQLSVRFDDAAGPPEPQPPGFTYATLVMAAGLAGIAYLKGPEPGDAYMAFRGSTIQAGTSASVFSAIALGALRGWWRPAALLPATYLVFVASSRTGLILWLGLSLLIVAARGLRTPRPRAPRSIAGDLLLLVAVGTAVMLPVGRVEYYPYASSRLGAEGGHVEFRDRMLTDAEALRMRYLRFLRLVRGPQVRSDLSLSELRRLEDEGLAESRWVMLSTSIGAVRSRPWGYWPESFAARTQIYCGRPPLCEYPHNLELEIGYHFGWPPLVLTALGLIVLGIRAAAGVSHPAFLARVSSIVLLGLLGFTQVSGDLVDHTVPLFAAIVWTLLGAAGSLMRPPVRV